MSHSTMATQREHTDIPESERTLRLLVQTEQRRASAAGFFFCEPKNKKGILTDFIKITTLGENKTNPSLALITFWFSQNNFWCYQKIKPLGLFFIVKRIESR